MSPRGHRCPQGRREATEPWDQQGDEELSPSYPLFALSLRCPSAAPRSLPFGRGRAGHWGSTHVPQPGSAEPLRPADRDLGVTAPSAPAGDARASLSRGRRCQGQPRCDAPRAGRGTRPAPRRPALAHRLGVVLEHLAGLLLVAHLLDALALQVALLGLLEDVVGASLPGPQELRRLARSQHHG